MTAKTKIGFHGGTVGGADAGTTHERLMNQQRQPGRPEGASIHRMGQASDDPDSANVGTPEIGSLPTPPQGKGPRAGHDLSSDVPTTGEGPDIEDGT